MSFADESDQTTDSPQSQAAPFRLTHVELVARRAFEIYCDRSCRDGHDIENWLEAENQLHQESFAANRRGDEPAPAKG